MKYVNNKSLFVAYEDWEDQLSFDLCEKRLFIAVLITAIEDLRNFHNDQARRRAESFFLRRSESPDLFSFDGICLVLDLDPETVLKQIAT